MALKSGKQPPHEKTLAGNCDISKGIALDFCPFEKEEIVISFEDVLDKRRYWEFGLIDYVLGDKVPFVVMTNFVDRHWNP
ncbi:hypothetical protein Droror1_Dr00026512 [Drosera rotundifolia]